MNNSLIWDSKPKVDIEAFKNQQRAELFKYFPEHRRMKKREFNNMVNSMKTTNAMKNILKPT